MSVEIINPGATYAGAPLQVGETKSFDPTTESRLVSSGYAKYKGDVVSLLSLNGVIQTSDGKSLLTVEVDPLFGGIENPDVFGAKRASSLGDVGLARVISPAAAVPYLKTVSNFGRFTKQTAAIKGSSHTYHDTILTAEGVVAVTPIYQVCSPPDDPTYTSDETLTVAAGPASALLDIAGNPNSPEGDSVWLAAAATLARQAGATQQAPIPVKGPRLAIGNVPRADGYRGNITMLRHYWAQSATTRGPIYHDGGPDGSASNIPLIRAKYPGSAFGMHYSKAGNYAASPNFSTLTGVTPIAATVLWGCYVEYDRPVLTVMIVGDSTDTDSQANGADATDPTHLPWSKSAVLELQLRGCPIDICQVSYPGYRWDQFGPWMQRIISAGVVPDVVVLPAWTPNGTGEASSNADTLAAAKMQRAQFNTYRAWLLANGVKEVVARTPRPSTSTPSAVLMQRKWAMDSGLPCFDLFSTVGDAATGQWKASNLTIDGTHETDVANEAVKVEFAKWLFKRYGL